MVKGRVRDKVSVRVRISKFLSLSKIVVSLWLGLGVTLKSGLGLGL